jgi:hypothetical protein
MKKFTFMSVFILLASFVFFACVKSEDTTIKIDNGYAYFPLKVGKYKIFQADSIVYDTLTGGKAVKVDSIRFFQKEIVVDTFVNQIGETVFRIERFERRKTSEPWIFKDVLSCERNAKQATRSDQGLRLLKMPFPLRKRQAWKSTLYVDEFVQVKVAGQYVELFKNWDSFATSLNIPETINGKKYANVATIKHADDENKLELRKVTEKYVRDTGLVFNEMLILDTQSTNNNETWRKKAQRGFIYRQYLIENN